MRRMREEIEDYVRWLGLDAYLVGGAVRDELLGLDSKDADFLVLGVDTEGLRAALAPHGRVEDLVVAGRLVGVRLIPRDQRDPRADAAPGSSSRRRARRCSTGPGRHDFEIVADPSLSVEDDMRRRDFTVNAMARRLDDGELVDPLGGKRRPRGAASCARSRRRASARIRCGSSARSGSSRSSTSSRTTTLLEQMREEAPA